MTAIRLSIKPLNKSYWYIQIYAAAAEQIVSMFK